MDCGTVNSMNEAANYIRAVEESVNFKIGCIEEIAFRQNWINKIQLSKIADSLGNNEYAQYLSQIAHKDSPIAR